jgi:hypothetical protein
MLLRIEGLTKAGNAPVMILWISECLLWMGHVRSYERRHYGLRAKLFGQKSLSTEPVGIPYISTPK